MQLTSVAGPLCLLTWLAVCPWAAAQPELRPPAYPLVTHDPYFSIWSFNDWLNHYPTRHWSGTEHPLEAYAQVDGQNYVLMLPNLTPRAVLPEGKVQPATVRYATQAPGPGWFSPGFNDQDWATGQVPFGQTHQPEPRTRWTSDELWYRQSFDLKDIHFHNLRLKVRLQAEAAAVYLNGIKVLETAGPVWGYRDFELPDQALATLQRGRNVLAVQAKNGGRHAYADVGLYDYQPPAELANVQPANQKQVKVTATQTAYRFTCGPTEVMLQFTSPLLPNDLETLSRPATYVTFTAASADGEPHQVRLFFGASGLLATHDPAAPVKMGLGKVGKQPLARLGNAAQPVLQRKGDDVRIDWGELLLLGERAQAGPAAQLRGAFLQNQPSASPALANLPATEAGLAITFDLGKVGSVPAERWLVLAYDDTYSVQYFGQNLRPWWRRAPGSTAEKMLAAAQVQYGAVMKKCDQFDKKLYDDALQAGGDEYAQLCQLAYRQAIAAHKAVADPQGKLLFFSKENFSNGSIGTVDVTYPSAPLFLLYSPPLLRGMLEFIFQYSEKGKWTKPFPAHDLGTYPLANGQTYPHDMPVEEAGNMLLLVAALAQAEGNPAYAKAHWKTLTTWAEFLKKEGLDPADQLCTDDFAGKLARNANLSVKAILALAAYGKLAGQLGNPKAAAEYQQLAREMALKWMNLARDAQHYNLAFGKPGTWSQKYNLVWDDLLGLKVFPPEVAEREVFHYLNQQGPYGLPLDSRKTYTKSDWVLWTATLARRDEDFKKLLLPIYRFAHETGSRVPLTDWHQTTNGLMVGFQARSVVGGYFIKTLKMKWLKY
ncbi:MAG: DUF4965 domain-containing protein [Bernardetiaceae bacterium]|jgi:hypothetical protein|nr:DUF4965 domain-containing protein [Bernardetiaceae bacterium]